MAAYATTEDVIMMYRDLSDEELERAEYLLDTASDLIRARADSLGINYDEYIVEHEYMAAVARTVVVDVVIRYLRQDQTAEPMIQQSQGALGYTWSGTSAVPGGGLINSFMQRDWKTLGLRRQRVVVRQYDYWNTDSDSD